MGASFFTSPPLVFCAEGLVCLVMMFTPSTITLLSSISTCFTTRGLFLSLSFPAITTTLSPFLILNFGLNLAFIFLFFIRRGGIFSLFVVCFLLQHFWRKGDDLHVTLVAEFPGNWPEDAGAARFVRLVQKNHCVVVEADVRTILTTKLVGGANDYRFCHGTFLVSSCGKCMLYW